MFMGLFNSLSIRIPLAMIGGILYGILTYAIVLTLNLQAQSAIGAGLLVFFLYLGSRLLILFSGIDTPYYSKERKGSPYENTAFYQTAQWVGKFYHVTFQVNSPTPFQVNSPTFVEGEFTRGMASCL